MGIEGISFTVATQKLPRRPRCGNMRKRISQIFRKADRATFLRRADIRLIATAGVAAAIRASAAFAVKQKVT